MVLTASTSCFSKTEPERALRHCPREQDCTVDKWCLNISTEFRDADFTQAARYYVLRHLAATIPDRDEAWRGITGDRCCDRHNRARIHDLSQPDRIAYQDVFLPTTRPAAT
jgi:hypothetical protein